MRKLFTSSGFIITILFVAILLVVFRPYMFDHKILFPSNLLVTAYAPWKYEPVPEYPNGPPNKPIGFDDIRQFFPNRQLLKNAFQKGIVPLWNPYIYSGTPFMASFDTAVWYPLSWIAAAVGVVEGWNFLVIILPIASLFFMYLFLRSLKFSPTIAEFGAFAYAFSGWMIVYWQEILVLEHSFLWLPLALYASNRLWEKRNDRLGFFLIVLALVSSVFGGFLQISMYVYAVVLCWNIYLFRVHRKIHVRIFIAIGLSLIIACIQLIPSIESFFLSPRGTENGLSTFATNLLPLQHLITFIAPDFWGNPGAYNYFGGPGFYFEKMIYIGIIPFIFALYGLIWVREKGTGFWKASAVIALSMGYALPTSWLPYILKIPVLSNSYPTRVFGVAAFALVILSCYGLSSFLRQPNFRRFIYVTGTLTVFLAAGWIVSIAAWCVSHTYVAGAFWCKGNASIFWNFIGYLPAIYESRTWYASVSLHNLIIPTVFVMAGWLLIPLRNKSWKLAFAFAGLVTVVSGLYFAQKYITFSDRKFVYPDLAVTREISLIAGYDRVWGYGNAFLEKNIPQYFGWFSSDGYGNLSSTRYAELLSTIASNGKLGGGMRRSDTDLYAMSQKDSMTSNPYRLRLMSLLDVRYILEHKEADSKENLPNAVRFPPAMFRLIWENNSWRIWQYTAAIPRAVFATNYKVEKNQQGIVDAIFDTHTNLSTTVILEDDPKVPMVTSGMARADITSYSLNAVRINTQSAGDGFVVFTDNYYPGWIATVDGKPVKVYRGDYTFKAVFVRKGMHTVIFQYAPQSVSIGGAVSVAGLIVMVLFLI